VKRKVKFQEGGAVRSSITNEPVGAGLRRFFTRPQVTGPRIRGSVGGPREQEDRERMAAEAAAAFDAEERALLERRAAQLRALTSGPSRITNAPVGAGMANRPAPAARPAATPEPAQAATASRAATEAAPAPRPVAEAPRPAEPSRPRPRPAAPAPREISADRLNDLMMGAEPATDEERVAQMRMRGRQQELEGRGTAFKKGGMVKYQEGGRVRAGRAGITASEAENSRRRNAAIESEQGAAEEIARSERMSGMRYRAPQRPQRTTDPRGIGDRSEDIGDPRAQPRYATIIGPAATVDEIGSRNRAYSRADRAAMDRDVRRMTGADSERAYKKGGMVKPKAKPVAKKAGGMVKSAPKKMMKGGIVAKPKSKAKPSGKPMPAFKKGGIVKKGKK